MFRSYRLNAALVALCLAWPPLARVQAEAPGPPEPKRTPILRAVDLNVGESAGVTLSNGKKVTVKLLDLQEERDTVRHALRQAQVRIEVEGKPATLFAGNYHLPVPVAGAGVQADCSVTKGCLVDCTEDSWGLEKDARIRLWPADSPWIEPGAFVYPVKQAWFASGTQMANEPVHVDGGEQPNERKTYYHSGLDIGGAEGMVDVVAATDGLVVLSGLKTLPGYEDTPAKTRYDVVYLLDDQGWYYRYSHLYSIDPAIQPGARVKLGQAIGVLGKEGGSGGWSHLHFEIKSRQPSGRWGTQEGYAFLWQAYQKQYAPEVTAVARPHHLAALGERVQLDGSLSSSRSGAPLSFEWTFGDGRKASGPRVESTYDRPGMYSEILKTTDSAGHVDYDFAVVHVLDPAHPEVVPPAIQAAYAPTLGLVPGQEITFKVRTFRTTDGQETWDFGDGSPQVKVRSDGNAVKLAKDGFAITTHRYAQPGDYLVRVTRASKQGYEAVARLHVHINERAQKNTN